MRTLYDAGARIVLSSDYDVGDVSPLDGMERMRQEHRVGSLEAGKRGDIVGPTAT